MSTRKSIVDQVITTLKTVSGVNRVTTEPMTWTTWQDADLNSIYVNWTVQNSRRAYYPQNKEMEEEILLTITGFVKSQFKEDVESDIDTLISGIETALRGDATLEGQVLDHYKTSVDRFTGLTERIGAYTIQWIVTYLYNKNSP